MFWKRNKKILEYTSKNDITYSVEIVEISMGFYHIKVMYNGEYLNRGVHSRHHTYSVNNGDFEKEIETIVNHNEPKIVSSLKYKQIK